jgi:hypothetical protein
MVKSNKGEAGNDPLQIPSESNRNEKTTEIPSGRTLATEWSSTHLPPFHAAVHAATLLWGVSPPVPWRCIHRSGNGMERIPSWA